MKKVKFILSIKALVIFFMLTGVLLILISNIFGVVENTGSTLVILTTLNNIGMTLLSAGLVSIVLEISTIQNLIKNVFSNLLDGNFPIEQYSAETLIHIKNRIAANRCKIPVEQIDNSLYQLEQNLIDSTCGLYYNFHFMIHTIRPCEEEKVFNKEVEYRYEIINESEYINEIFHTFALYNLKPNMKKEELINEFSVLKFEVNNVNLLNEVKDCLKFENFRATNDKYDYLVTFSRKLQNCKKHRVNLQFKYKTPINDLTYVYKMFLPSKKLDHRIVIQNEKNQRSNWKLRGNAFTSFFDGYSKSEKYCVENDSDTIFNVKFNAWSIPGAGYVVSYNKMV